MEGPSLNGFFKVNTMRKFASLLLLSIAATPAFAEVNVVPEPESLALLAVGVAGLLVTRLKK